MTESVKPPRDTRRGNPEHWLPANFRKGTPQRPKSGFKSEALALAHARANQHAYLCSTCDEWHLGSRKRDL